MAMELTHVRFAHDLKEVLKVTDENAYYCGAIYPDSRYVTGMCRDKTHGNSMTRDPFTSGLTDFEKGWSTHLLYDRKASSLYRALTPEPDRVPEGTDEQWVLVSAIKLLEDIESYECSPESAKIICALEYESAPQNEEMDVLHEYAAIQQKLYQTKPGDAEYKELFDYALSKDLREKIMRTAKQYQEDLEAMNSLRSIYKTVLEEVLKR
jgi:hypothetical protein